MDDHNLSQWIGNIVSAGAIVTSVLGWAPAIAALVALIWYVIQIRESATVRRWIAMRRHHKLARLRARVLMLEAQQKEAIPFFPDDER